MCFPPFDLTVGMFSGGNGSLFLTASYGTAINALIFYGNANHLLKTFQLDHDAGAYLMKLIGGFTALTALESILDLVFFLFIFKQAFSSYALEEIVFGNILTHTIFFLVPSFLYRFTLDWLKPKEENQPESTQPEKETLAIKSGGTLHQVPIVNLEFIESDGNYVVYHYNQQKLMVRESLSKVMEKLPDHRFVRCHKSFIVSTKHVTKLDYDFIYLSGNQIPIGRVYRERVNEVFQSS